MSQSNSLAHKITEKYQKIASSDMPAPLCFVGFDGFTDEISCVVQERDDKDHFEPAKKMVDFGKRINDAAGKSCNIELVVKKIKLGGNAPILTNALVEGGHEITFAGTIGEKGDIEPIFQEMASRCDQVILLGKSGHTDAIEFEDGKVLLGKLEPMRSVDYDRLIARMGKEELISALDETDLFVSTNWTMLPNMTDLWEQMAEEILPKLSDSKRCMFIDLCDPAKRRKEDLHKALDVLKKFRKKFKVILGLNEAEAEYMAHVLDCEVSAGQIQRCSELDLIVVHAVRWATAADSSQELEIEGPYTSKPVLLTGAGDNFNAGFCNGLLYGLSTEECLRLGVFTSGYYVRKGKSPTIDELAKFLRQYKKEESQ